MILSKGPRTVVAVSATLALIVSPGPPPELRSPAATVIGAVAAFASG